MKISKKAIARYELEIMQRGVCADFAPLCFAEEQEDFIVEITQSGFSSLDSWLRTDRSFLFDGYKRLLRFLCMLARTLTEAETYLINADHISLQPEDLLLEGDRLRLVPSETPKPLESKFAELLTFLDFGYPAAHASFILDQLPEHFEASQLLKLLTRLALQLYD